MRIFHTGDIHIGMRFDSYGNFQDSLRNARLSVVRDMICTANTEKCDLFVITGDLFDHHRIPKTQIKQVCDMLSEFAGALVVVIAGNHDFDDGCGSLWDTFRSHSADNTVVLNTFEPFSLDEYGFPAVVHSAYCEGKHSSENHVHDIHPIEGKLNIALAHGAIEGLSCDHEKRYFPMTQQELKDSGMDLWLIGHTHVRYPDTDSASDTMIFNAGTPEPDGWNCTRGGNAWIVDIPDSGNITASAVQTGTYRFYDLCVSVSTESQMQDFLSRLSNLDSPHKLFRIALSGDCDEDLWAVRETYFSRINTLCDYLDADFSAFHKKISLDDIQNEFPEQSFPYALLTELRDDDEAMRIAYELIKEAM